MGYVITAHCIGTVGRAGRVEAAKRRRVLDSLRTAHQLKNTVVTQGCAKTVETLVPPGASHSPGSARVSLCLIVIMAKLALISNASCVSLQLQTVV